MVPQRSVANSTARIKGTTFPGTEPRPGGVPSIDNNIERSVPARGTDPQAGRAYRRALVRQGPRPQCRFPRSCPRTLPPSGHRLPQQHPGAMRHQNDAHRSSSRGSRISFRISVLDRHVKCGRWLIRQQTVSGLTQAQRDRRALLHAAETGVGIPAATVASEYRPDPSTSLRARTSRSARVSAVWARRFSSI